MFLPLLFLLTFTTSYTREIGTPHTQTATKVLMLGAGELAKEVIIELQRLGVQVHAADRYQHAPGMQVAHYAHVINLQDGEHIRALVKKYNPHFIVPEIEAINTAMLTQLEEEGFTVIPNARAVQLTMNREGIRRAAAEELKLKTSAYRFASSQEEFNQAVEEIGVPCVVKPIMSSSGKGQSIVNTKKEISLAWDYARNNSRGVSEKVIVEEFIPFDYEITLLTVRTNDGTFFCKPIGHKQINGDYRESWQPHPMSTLASIKAHQVAQTITDYLGGLGIFGVELFVKGDEVYFSEVSPRPHDTGMVTLISQNLSEFALHARAILGLPIPLIEQYGPSASSALLMHGTSRQPFFTNIHQALTLPQTDLRLFGKPEIINERRMGVGLARGETIDQAIEKAKFVTNTVKLAC